MSPLVEGRSAHADSLQTLEGAAAIYALLNLLLAATLIATQPARAADLRLMYSWCERWLIEGRHLYATTVNGTDYPPNAIVLYSPLTLLPWAAVVPIWAACNAALTPVCALLIVRASAVRRSVITALFPTVLFLCWGGVRMLLQFTRLALALTYGALLLADSRPVLSGLLLGLALAKPQIAGPIALWMLLTGRFRPVAVAGVVIACGFGIYVLRAQSNPLDVAYDYWRTLSVLYGPPDRYVGRTSFRVWTAAITDNVLQANALWVAGCAALLVVPCRAALADGNWRTSRAGAAAPALFCLWSLLVWFNLGNNLVLIFPAFVYLLEVHDPPTLRQRRWVCAVLQLTLMLDVPVNFRTLAPHLGALRFLIVDFDRFAVIGTFGYVAFLWRRFHRLDFDQKPGVRLNWNTHP